MTEDVRFQGTPSSAVRTGALEGLVAWTVYWSIRNIFLHVIPRIGVASYEYMPPSAGFAALLLVIYVAAGLTRRIRSASRQVPGGLNVPGCPGTRRPFGR